ncbi:MAG: SEC-C domain-containing protein [Methanothrix sp.]|jgi:uncharacterized protein YchJ|nr:SEC-C domain-containing protein [Methanothrix sp.]
MINEVIPLEEQGEEGEELSNFFEALANGRKPFGIKAISIIGNDIYIKTDTIVNNKSVGRNDPCPYCNSGKKYKKCCGKE